MVESVAFDESSQIYARYTGTSVMEVFTGICSIHIVLQQPPAYAVDFVDVIEAVGYLSGESRSIQVSTAGLRYPFRRRAITHSLDATLCRSIVETLEFFTASDGASSYPNAVIIEENTACHPATATLGATFGQAPVETAVATLVHTALKTPGETPSVTEAASKIFTLEFMFLFYAMPVVI
jgi:hypothetical protein